MYFIVYYDKAYGSRTLVLDGIKGLLSMTGILENAKIQFKPYSNQSYLSQKEASVGGYEYWMEETTRFG